MSDQGAAVKPSAVTTPEPPAASADPDTERAAGAAGATTTDLVPRGATGEQPRVRMRQRLARLGTTRPQTPVLDPLFQVIRANHPKADLSVVERAYHTAEQAHRGQLRKSGDAYITHPLAVTTILAELGMTETTLCAALLHDTVEDTSYTLAQLTRDFGDEVALLVDGCTKLDKVKYGESAKSETIRKMVVAMSRDIRVLVIKLADRLHNMRTLHYLRPDKQSRIATETLEIFAPLAHRLGMNAIKWELEDLAFATLHPKVYDEIVRLVAEAAPSRDELLAGVIEQVQADLKAAKIKATVTGRPKHYYSIYQKMVVRGRDFQDIYDLVGLRVLVEDNRDCYAALGVLHVRWNPLPGRFKDYIAMPKFNMYQSLHTTVLGPTGQAGRAADPHRGDAPAGRVRRRRALEVQGGQGRAADGEPGGHRRAGVGPAADGLAARVRRPGGVPRLAAVRDQLHRGVRLHPQGRGDLPAAGLDAGRLRLRHPHRGRPPDRRCPGQRPAGAAGVRSSPTATWSRSSPPRPRAPDPSRDWLAFVGQPPGAQQDPPPLHPRAPRGVDRGGQGGAGPADAQGRPAPAAAAHPRAPHRGGRLLQARRTSPASTPRWARARSAPRPWSTG